MKEMKTMWMMALMGVLLFIRPAAFAQNGGRFELGADLYSRYVWRGSDFGNSPAVQPRASYINSGFTLGAWGSYSINSNSMQESDLFVSYDFNAWVTFIITDYFLPNGTSANNNYFDYREDSTGHTFEASAILNAGAGFPVSLLVAYNFYGADPGHAFYTELGYEGSLKDVGYKVFLGGGTGAYYLADRAGRDFGLVNLGITLSKDIRITDRFELPVSTSLITNPTAESIFIVFGLSL